MVMSLALLHTGARIGWTHFTVHPSTVIGIAGLAALYEAGKRRESSGKRAADGASLPLSAPRFPFYASLVTLFLSLNGPLHDLSDSYLFSAHMLQHLLLAFVVAPLMIMGVSGEMLRPALRLPGVRAAAEWLTKPIRSFAIFT